MRKAKPFWLACAIKPSIISCCFFCSCSTISLALVRVIIALEHFFRVALKVLNQLLHVRS